MSKRYVKKQVVVEAMQWTGDNLDEVRRFCGLKAETYNSGLVNVGPMIVLQTPDGPAALKVGDYAVKDEDGIFFLYRQEAFEEHFTEYVELATITDAVRAHRDGGDVTVEVDSIGAAAGTTTDEPESGEP